jgi:hypothetical protein
MHPGWVEGSTGGQFSRRLLAKKFGIVCLRLKQQYGNTGKWDAEIELHGCVVQTGLYRGEASEVTHQLWTSAFHLFDRAIKDLTVPMAYDELKEGDAHG